VSFRTKRVLLILGILIFAVGISALLSRMKPPPPTEAVGDVELLVDVETLASDRYDFTVESQGTVRPLTETVLSAEISGPVVDVSPKFVAGGVFAAGEELMRIDQANYIGAVQQSRAIVKQRQIEFEGAKKLRTQGYRAETEYAAAEAALATAQAELIRAERDLDRTRIRLPYEGMVRSRSTDLGQFVNPGKELGVVFATDYAEVRLPLTDEDLAFVHLPSANEITESGMSYDGPEVTLHAIRHGKPASWTARIVRSEGVVDERARVTYAVARVRDPYNLHDGGHDTPLAMGTFVRGVIRGAEIDSAVRIPRSALRRNNDVVFVDADNRIRIRSVIVLRTDDRYAYLSPDGLVGERICLTPIESPLNGVRVRTTDDGPAEQEEQIASEE